MKIKPIDLKYLSIDAKKIYRNLTEDQLIQQSIDLNQGRLTNTNALLVSTGEFTGRSPKDRFIVEDKCSKNTVHWGDINQKISDDHFRLLQQDISHYLGGKTIYVRDVSACADPEYKMKVRVLNEYPWQNLFVRNMFIECTYDQLEHFIPDWHVIAAPGFKADPKKHGTRSENFAVISFNKRTILIGGTAYTGEIKKGIFSALNLILPKKEAVLSMHCSANIGENGDSALFFGLSGTGKTTLSSDPKRKLIGDDEHGWSSQGIFNFEGGCYAKTIDLKPKSEPLIFHAIKKGAVVENMTTDDEGKLNFTDDSITQNIRVSYPISHIPTSVTPSMGSHPKNIFFLTYDAFGVLPAISKLTPEQAMYQFISGFTSKVAGTETGITEPKITFSACYGEPFMPLHPMEYAKILGDKIRKHNVDVWLINTGLQGGKYGVGKRISLSHTRKLIHNVLEGNMNEVEYEEMPVFKFKIPTSSPGLPSDLLNPKLQWANPEEYDECLHQLAEAFIQNQKRYSLQLLEEDLKEARPEIVEMI